MEKKFREKLLKEKEKQLLEHKKLMMALSMENIFEALKITTKKELTFAMKTLKEIMKYTFNEDIEVKEVEEGKFDLMALDDVIGSFEAVPVGKEEIKKELMNDLVEEFEKSPEELKNFLKDFLKDLSGRIN